MLKIMECYMAIITNFYVSKIKKYSLVSGLYLISCVLFLFSLFLFACVLFSY